MKHFRGELGATLRDVQTAAKLSSHAHVRSIETGAITPTRATAERIAEALKGLGLAQGDYERMILAIKDGTPLVAPGFMVGADELIRCQLDENIREVWVGAEEPLEEERTWLIEVAKNIQQHGKKYVYFVRDQLAWDYLYKKLRGQLGTDEMIHRRVTAIVVPRVLHPFFFHPPFALYLVRGEGVIGVWAFQEPQGESIDSGCEMDRTTANALHVALVDVVRHARSGQDFAIHGPTEGPLQFTVVHRPTEEEGR